MLIGFTFSHLFSAESRTGEVSRPLPECHAMFCLFLKCCSHQLNHLKLISIFRAISLPFVQPLQDHFHVWQNHSNSSSSILPCFASQFLICFEILHLAQPAVNLDFVTMLIRVGVHKPGLFHFYFFQLCALLWSQPVFPLLSCPCSFSCFHSYFPHYVEQTITNTKMWQMWWHFSMYKTRVSVTSNFMAGSSTSWLTLALRGFVAQQITWS